MRIQPVVCAISMIAAYLVISLMVMGVSAQDSSAQVSPVQIAQYPGAPFHDQSGNYWFGTVLEGVIRYDGDEFISFTTEDGLAGNMIRDILQTDDGRLWFATDGGLTIYDGGAFRVHDKYEPIRVTKGWSKHGNHRDLWDAHIDREGTLWIATMDGVFYRDGEVFQRFPMPVTAPQGKFEFAPTMVSSIYEDKNGDLWFGTDGAGVVRFDGDSTVVYNAENDGLSSDNISSVFQDSRGSYWIGTANGGVNHFDGTTFTTHLRSKEFSEHSGWGRYFGIHEDQEGNVWFGAAYEGGGVYRYDGEHFEYLSTEHGLGNGGVPSIREDNYGNLWFGTTAGVYHFSGQRFINFSKTNPQLPVSSNESGGIKTSQPIALEGWADETFALPPHFAPELPAGTESLRFAPGWRDPGSENFWSYAFVMSIDEPVPNAGRAKDLLALYYDGLLSVFAHKKYGEVSIKPARIQLETISHDQYRATMQVIDAFATFEPIEINVLIRAVPDLGGRSFVHIQLSSQPYEHTIWKSLDLAIERIQLQMASDEKATHSAVDE